MHFTAGWIGGPEIIIIVIVILLLFGGRKIPELAKGIGKGIREFRKATDESELAKDIKDIKSEFDDVKKDVDNLDPTKQIKKVNPLKTKKK
jgi:sec-independent protein translocase protein TatA